MGLAAAAQPTIVQMVPLMVTWEGAYAGPSWGPMTLKPTLTLLESLGISSCHGVTTPVTAPSVLPVTCTQSGVSYQMHCLRPAAGVMWAGCHASI